MQKLSFNWLSFILLFGMNNALFAQLHQQPSVLKKTPEWKITADKKELKVGDEVTLTLTSDIEKDWYMYSNDFDPNLGPIVAEITFKKNKTFALVGKTTPQGAKQHYEEIWNGNVSIFTGKAVFKQKVKILSDKPQIKIDLYFQECSEVTGVCMPPFEQTYEVKNVFKVIAANEEHAVDNQLSAITAPVDHTAEVATVQQTPDTTTQQQTENSKPKTANNKPSTGDSFLGFMILAFLGGLVAVATPCVFPMLPMTVSFFTKKSESRAQGITRASIFGFSIIAIYASLGLVFAFFGLGPDFGNWLSTHWLPNILFFIIFMVFAASFFGLFEITLPHGFVNKVDSKSSMTSLGGIFFMAFTLVLVSFSCTGPIVGSLLIDAVGGKFLKPLLGMAAFGAGLALPFTLFAIFPSFLSNLPKSGGWLNSVKVVLGFIEVAFAFKFLSTADVVYHWGILDREIYLSIWIVVAFLLGMYLLGKLKFSHDSDMPYVSVPRFALALVSFTFGVYMIPGLFGAPLKGLSGLLPPMQTQDFVLGGENTSSNHQISSSSNGNIKHADFLHLPHGLTGYFDYKQALEESKKQGKPIFIDFTGHACVNCRKMEEYVWAKPEVLKRLQNDFIIVSLYADERKELPESDWYTSPRDGKVKKTIGAQNQDLQISKYNFSAQPQYVVIDANENQLSGPNFFDTDEQKFIDFLDSGKKAFDAKK
ncbi:MAG: protein-disulfide reductase DsbD domain-containing protein [Bacteroidota bacterium]